MLNGKKGFMRLAPLLVIVVLAGAWYLHKSFKENRLHEGQLPPVKDRELVKALVDKEA